MGFGIKCSPKILEVVESIAEYIVRDSNFYAKAVVSKIFKSTENLKNFSKLGSFISEIGEEDIGELVVYCHHLVHQIKK